MSPIRRLYFYAASLFGFFALLVSVIFLIRHVAVGWVGAASPADVLLVGPGIWWLLLAAVALTVWLVHWIPTNRAARSLTMAAAAERSSLARKTYLYLGQLSALAAAVAQAVLAIRSAVLWLVGGAATSAAAVSLAAGGFSALLAWIYLRWENGRDDDLGREVGLAVQVRRFYIYGFALLGLALASGGSGELLRSLVALLTRPLDASLPWREPFATAVAALAVGLPLTLLAWRRAHYAARVSPVAEANALSRVTLRYSVLLLGTTVTLLSLGYLIEQLALLILRQPADVLPQMPLLAALDWTYAVAYLPAAVIVWASFADGIREDVALGGERARTPAFRRLVRYLIAAATLAAFWLGLTEFARLILQVVLGSAEGGLAFAPAWWGRFARAIALVSVAAPAWWGHWWSQQVRARATGPAGQSERASLVRRVYLWSVVLIGAVLGVAALGFGAFLALNWSATSTLGGVRAAVAGAVAAAGVALFWTLAHALVLRGDARRLTAERGASVVVPPEPVQPSAAAPQPASIAPGPRRYRREDLAALAAGAGGGVPLAGARARALAVIDGGDGAIGGALVVALHRTRPDIVLWPIGLNAAAQVAMLDALGGGLAPPVPTDALSRAAGILGPADILIPGGLDGEVTADLVAAVTSSPGRVLLLPPRDPHVRWVAAPDWPLARWVENAAIEAAALVG